jgi:hypothetical protein
VVPGDAGDSGSDAAQSVDSSVVRRDDAGMPLDRFVTKVIAFMPGDCAGFGASSMPDIVFGPPVGAGDRMGGLDVVSLGVGGTITLGFEPRAIVDGPGPDFIVFENAFFIAGDPMQPFAEPGEVSVSDDGMTWKTYPCTAMQPPYGACSGWKPVYSNPQNGISPFDPAKAGGEAYDLADVGLTHARYVRIRDMGYEMCPADPSKKTTTMGYDLDAIAIVNAQ